jgi:hypothetical protein
VIRLPNGDLVLHSPIPATDALANAVTAVGPVKHLIAPNLLHHLSVAAWHQRFPDAQLHAAPGLAKKRPDLRISAELGVSGSPPWAGVLDQQLLRGMPKLAESVFFHRPSRSLLVTDLLFNIVRPANLFTKVVLTMTGTRGRLAMSRVNRLYTKDRAALRASLEVMLAWDFTRIVVAHGDIVEARRETSAQSPSESPGESSDLRQRTRDVVSWGLRA